MIDKNIKVEYLNISDLIPYENNAKLHPDEQINQIAKSIKEFGFNDPIAIDQNNIIIEGHGRLLAAQKLKLKEVPVIKLLNLTEEQKKAYIIAHNKLTMNSGFDLEVLFSELESLDGDMQDLTGFNDEEISDIFNQLSEDIKEKKISEDTEWDYISQTGDIWLLNNHKIICGDTTKSETFEKLLGNKKIDLIVTDPPYNVEYNYSPTTIDGIRTNRKIEIKNDNLGDQFPKFITEVFTNFETFLKPGGVFYIFYASTYEVPVDIVRSLPGLNYRQQLIWVKDVFTLGRSDYQWRHEPIIYGNKIGDRYMTFDRTQSTVIDNLHNKELEKLTPKELIEIIKELKDQFETTVIYEDKPSRAKLHPTTKPVNLLKRFIRNSSKLNELVFDGFLGSGSTLIAADQLKRICYGIEYEPKYIDTIVARFINTKLEAGEEFTVTLIRDNEEYDYTQTGIEEVLEYI